MLYVFLSKPFEEWNFEKFSSYVLGQVFFSQKSIVFKWKQIRFKNFINFCFASSDSLKALTGCFEKLENLAKRFGVKKDLKQPVTAFELSDEAKQKNKEILILICFRLKMMLIEKSWAKKVT